MTDFTKLFAGGKAFIPFITVGDPDLETSGKMIRALSDAGAALIELGIPFSDPTAEGPVIQAANERGLKSGTRPDDVLTLAKDLKEGGLKAELAIMTYANVVFSYGIDRFLTRMEEAGFCALILPDVPFEEKREFSGIAEEHGIALISLIAPTSHERIERIARDASGFIYCVSSLGVTGMRNVITTDVGAMVREVKAVRPDIPVAIGFGISNAETAAKMARLSDGVIIGSAIVDIIAKKGRDAVPFVADFARGIVQAIS